MQVLLCPSVCMSVHLWVRMSVTLSLIGYWRYDVLFKLTAEIVQNRLGRKCFSFEHFCLQCR